MKIPKYMLVKIINELKSIVQKNDAHPALDGILISKGYAIASNAELTMQVQIDGSEDDRFIIPSKAFDLIAKLPDGEVSVTCKDLKVTVKMDSIKNTYQTYDPDQFIFEPEIVEPDGTFTAYAPDFITAISNVSFAAQDGSKSNLGSICIDATGDTVNLVALDGKRCAWDKIKATIDKDMMILLPKSAAKKLSAITFRENDNERIIEISYTKNNALIKCGDYKIQARQIDGKFFSYKKLFKEQPLNMTIGRVSFMSALERARMCAPDKAVRLEMQGDSLQISNESAASDYSESLNCTISSEDQFLIGFNPKLLTEALKILSKEDIEIGFETPKSPAIIKCEGTELLILVLPTVVKGAA